jgi:hypothetical protein
MSEVEIKKLNDILTIDGCESFWKKISIFFKLMKNAEVLYTFFYLGFAILAMSVHYFFFSYHLIEFLKNQPVLVNVLKSVINPRKQLILIFLFFLILEYFYTLVIYYFFYDVMPQYSCESVIVCLATVYTQTFTVK